MPPDLKVVPIKDNCVSLRDISGFLRKTADTIDECTTSSILSLFVVHYDDNGEVHVKNFGDNPSRVEVVGMLMQAAHDLMAGD